MNTQYWLPQSYYPSESSEVYQSYQHQPQGANAWMQDIRASNQFEPTFVEQHSHEIKSNFPGFQKGSMRQNHGWDSSSDFILQEGFEGPASTRSKKSIESHVHECYDNEDSFLLPIAPCNGDVVRYTPEHCYPFPTRGITASQPEPRQTQTQTHFQVSLEQHDLVDLSDSLGTLSWSNQSSSTLSPCFSVPADDQDPFTQFPVNEAHWEAYETHRPEQIFSGSLETSQSSHKESGTDSWLSRNEEASEQLDINLGSEAFGDLTFPTCSPLTQATNSGFDMLFPPRYPAESVEDAMGEFLLSPSEKPVQRSALIVPIPNNGASLADTSPPDVELIPQEQVIKNADDLYVPRWIRGQGKNREAWCGTCDRWFSLKRSAYWYHQNFSHGIHRGGYRYPQPIEIRRTMMQKAWDGLCGSCERWIPLGSSNKTDTSWYRHVYKVGLLFRQPLCRCGFAWLT